MHKLRFFTMLAMIIAWAAVGGSNRRVNEFDIAKPNTRPHDWALAADAQLWYASKPTNEADPSLINALRAVNEMPAAALLPIQSRNTKDLGAGKLLVASRDLGDPHFAETVILLVHYDAQGVVGLILNRRTDFPLSHVLTDLKTAKDRTDPVYLGGPVEPPAVFALFKSPTKVEGAEHVFGGVYLITAKNLFEQTISTRPDPGIFHVYLGYAGWTIDQLRKEVEVGAWFIFPADAKTVFDADPDSLWPQMIRKTELKVAENGAYGCVSVDPCS